MPVAIPTFGNVIGQGMDQNVSKWLSIMSAQPSSVFIENLNTMVFKLKAEKIWDQLDRFWLFATENRQHAKICIKSLSAITEVNSINWTANQGYSGNGTSTYINTNFIASTLGENYQTNDASIGLYSRDSGTSTGVDIGVFQSGVINISELLLRFSTNLAYVDINTNASNSVASTNGSGLFLGKRINNSSVALYRNGNILGTTLTQASSGRPNIPIYMAARNEAGVAGSFTSRQYSMCCFGSSIINQTAFYQVFQEFATKQGFNV